MLKVRVVKIILIFLIFAVTTNTPVLASTAKNSQITRSKINYVSNKASSRTIFTGCKSNLKIVSLSSTHHTNKLLIPDDVIIIESPTSMIFNSISAVLIQTPKKPLNNPSDIFIPPRASL
jgi:late competence protein required for DNA uptake (superfamily II DNA/RNA helicase)